MPINNYRIRLEVIGAPAFTEASKEELRVLLALVQLDGEVDSTEALAEAVMISPARCKAALAFWEESGIISPDDGRPTITEEFEERLVRGEIDVVPAVKVAKSIRDEELAGTIEECAKMMNKACLSNEEVKGIVALHTQYSLSSEYIATLAAHLSSKGDLTVRKLCNEAIHLSEKGCSDFDSLEAHLKYMEEASGAEWEFRRVLGIYGRNLSQSERKYFKKWAEEFGYSVSIVSEAYDIAVLNTKSGRGDLRYMDSVLTSWHEAGCRTVNECLAMVESERAKRTADKAASEPKKKSKSTPETPRYGNFDINEAFNNAVARSFGGSEEGKVD